MALFIVSCCLFPLLVELGFGWVEPRTGWVELGFVGTLQACYTGDLWYEELVVCDSVAGWEFCWSHNSHSNGLSVCQGMCGAVCLCCIWELLVVLARL